MRADDARLQEVLRLRKENFDTHAGPTPATAGSWCRAAAGRRGRARSAMLLPPLDVADLGCGEGYLTIEAARWATQVIAVDRSADVLGARQGARRAADACANIMWKRGELEKLPIEDAASTWRCCRRRCTTPPTRRRRWPKRRASLEPGGRVLVLDLRAHDEDWVRDEARRPLARLQRRAS